MSKNKIILSVIVAVVALSILTVGIYRYGLYKSGSFKCYAEGGSWKIQGHGLPNNFVCIKNYPDAGKPCSSSRECLGGCYKGTENGPATCKKDNLYCAGSTVEDWQNPHLKELGILGSCATE